MNKTSATCVAEPPGPEIVSTAMAEAATMRVRAAYALVYGGLATLLMLMELFSSAADSQDLPEPEPVTAARPTGGGQHFIVGQVLQAKDDAALATCARYILRYVLL